MRKPKANSDYQEAVERIAHMGHGMKESLIDWSNIGKSAVHLAKEAMAGSCKCCGRRNVWQPTREKK